LVSGNATATCSLIFNADFSLKFEIQGAARTNSINQKYHGTGGTNKMNTCFLVPFIKHPPAAPIPQPFPLDLLGSAVWQLGYTCLHRDHSKVR